MSKIIAGLDDDAFLKACAPHLQKIEATRLDCFKSYKFRFNVFMFFLATAFVVAALSYLQIFWTFQTTKVLIIAGIFAMVGILAWMDRPVRKYESLYKELALPQIASLFGDFIYNPKSGINLDELYPSQILPDHDKAEFEDHFQGVYGGVNIEFCELFLQKEHRTQDEKGRTKVSHFPVFRGVAILIDLNHKKFLGHTILLRNSGKIGQWLNEKMHDLKRAKMADVEFEKIYDVYTNDQVEARWLIDPVIIERLTTLYAECKASQLMAAFFDSKMLVLVANHLQRFEPPGLSTPATDPKALLGLKHEVGDIVTIIDKLKLYDPAKAHQTV